jgi:hypothetical protein
LHGVGDWHIAHDPRGTFTGVSLVDRPVGFEVFADSHTYLSTSPTSRFIRTVTVQRRGADCIDIMRGRRDSRTDDAGTSTITYASRQAWFGALRDVFALEFDLGVRELERLWDGTVTTRREPS